MYARNWNILEVFCCFYLLRKLLSFYYTFQINFHILQYKIISGLRLKKSCYKNILNTIQKLYLVKPIKALNIINIYIQYCIHKKIIHNANQSLRIKYILVSKFYTGFIIKIQEI
jgi:hypothetical protein